jgi:hypothetical protein
MESGYRALMDRVFSTPIPAIALSVSEHIAEMDSIDSEKAPSCSPKKLLIMMLHCLMLVVFSFGAFFFGFPLYVALKECHGMKIVLFLVRVAFSGIWKSYSYDIVDCSRPVSGFGASSVSLILKV